MIIDADAHVLETEHTWDFLDPSESKYRPRLASSTDDPGRQYWVIDGKFAGLRFPTLTEQELARKSKSLGRNLSTPEKARGVEDVSLRVSHLDELGIDVQVLHNTLWVAPVTERPDIEVALARSWNRWMADVWRQAKGRLRWTCVIPTLELEEAAKELRFASSHGAVGVCLRPFEHDLMLTDPYFYGLFEECAHLDLAIIVHTSNGSPRLRDLLQTRYPIQAGFVSFTLPTIAMCFSLFSGDIPKQFPTLRWAFIELAAGWVPWMLHNLCRRGSDIPRNAFEEYKVYVTTEMDDDHQYILDYVGENVLLMGTDYGHTDVSSEVDAIQRFRALASLSEGVKMKVLSTNPRTLFNLDAQ